MIKYITALISLFLLDQSILLYSNDKYDEFDYIRKDSDGKYILIAKQGDKYGVIDLFGNPIIQPEFKYISYTQDSLFIIATDSGYGISNLQGKQILPAVYDKKNVFLKSKNFDLLTKNGKLGVFNRNIQTIIIPVIYDCFDTKDYGDEQAIRLNDRLQTQPRYCTIVAYRNHNDTIKASLIDLTTGKTMIEEGIYDIIQPSDRCGYIIGSKDSLNQVVDYNGNVIVPFQHENLTIGSNGFISWGDCSRQFISKDSSHKSILYSGIVMYNNGVSSVLKGCKQGIINSDGKEIVPAISDNVYVQDKHIMAIDIDASEKKTVTTYLFDLEGKSLFPALNYGEVKYDQKADLAIVRENNNVGLINRKGKFILPLKYRRIYIDHDADVIQFELNTNSGIKVGLADMEGRILVAPKYDQINEFIDGTAEVEINVKNQYWYGLINSKGQEILRPQFSSIFFNMDHAQKYAQVYNDNNKIGVITRDGRITVFPKYEKIIYQDKSDDDWGDLAITKLNNHYGVVNINTGQVIAESDYNYIFAIGKGDSLLFCLRSEQGNRVINKDGKVIIPLTQDLIYPVQYSKDYRYLIRSQSNGKKGIVSISGENLIPPIYDNISQLNCNLFKVQLGDNFGIVDKHNKLLLPIEYDFIEPYLYPDANLLFAKKGDKYGYISLEKILFEPSSIAQQLYEACENNTIGL